MASCTFRQALVNISELHPNLSRPSIKGIVIGKTDVKGFPDRKNIGSERYTFSFTIRDSPSAFINASSWGREEYIKSLCESFRVGDCVLIENPLVQTKDLEREEKFNPSTPGPYKLLISEVHSVVKISSKYDNDSLLPLLRVPPQLPHDYYSLEDIVANGQSLNGAVINILAAVRWVGEIKYFTTSDKRTGQRCEVKLFDYSVDTFPLICWSNESIQLAQSWTPRETVLFVSEVRINYDSFRNSMVATVVSKTIFTPNPDFPQAHALFNYVKDSAANEAFLEVSDENAESLNLETIKDVYTVQQMKERASQDADRRAPLHGILFAFISLLNVDDNVQKIVRNRCSCCRYLIKDPSEGCVYSFCNEMSQDPKSAITSLDLQMDITDHTGTLSCNLSDKVAEDTLSCTVDGFFNLTEDQKTSLKWNFVLERFKIYVKVSPSPRARHGLRVNILSCQKADPHEALTYMSSRGDH